MSDFPFNLFQPRNPISQIWGVIFKTIHFFKKLSMSAELVRKVEYVKKSIVFDYKKLALARGKNIVIRLVKMQEQFMINFADYIFLAEKTRSIVEVSFHWKSEK